jgi:hypothetical protein
MLAVIHMNSAPHQVEAGRYMATGLRRHGIDVEWGEWNSPYPCDFAVCWGGRQKALFQVPGTPVLVMERGHVGDRLWWTSCGWNGLGRRAQYPQGRDKGARWRSGPLERLLKPWTDRPDGYALLLGQVEGDAAVGDLDLRAWGDTICRGLLALGWRQIEYRRHPYASQMPIPEGASPAAGGPDEAGLQQDLRGAGLCVTYNSTAGVQAVLAGVPTVTLDVGAMAWPVTTHSLDEAPIRPSRYVWVWDLAWTQWTQKEIGDGVAWDALRTVPGVFAE